MSMIIPAGGIRKKNLIRQFLDQGAASPETAQTLHDIGAWKGVGDVYKRQVKVGERGQIVLPKKARDLFQIKQGDLLVVLGDENPERAGIALVPGDTVDVYKRQKEVRGKNQQYATNNDKYNAYNAVTPTYDCFFIGYRL